MKETPIPKKKQDPRSQITNSRGSDVQMVKIASKTPLLLIASLI
jgi:hypothetical protein